MFYIDPTYLWCVLIPTLIISIGVQVYLKSTFAKWGKVRNHINMNGEHVAQALFDRTSLQAIPIQQVGGSLVLVAVGEVELASSRTKAGPAALHLVHVFEDRLKPFAFVFDDETLGLGYADWYLEFFYDDTMGEAVLDCEIFGPACFSTERSSFETEDSQRSDCNPGEK